MMALYRRSMGVLGIVFVTFAFSFSTELKFNVKQSTNEFIVIAGDSLDGMEMAVVSVKSRMDPEHQIQAHMLKEGSTLSQACGSHPTRCRELLVVSDMEAAQHIAFVPLQNGVYILDFRYNGSALNLQTEMDFAYDTENCMTMDIFHISSSYYVFCLNGNSLHLCILELNTTHVDSSSLRSCRPIVNFPTSNAIDLTQFSNFELIDIRSSSFTSFREQILFAYQTTFYRINPVTDLHTPLQNVVVDNQCQYVTNIVQADNSQVHLYCDDGSTLLYDYVEDTATLLYDGNNLLFYPCVRNNQRFLIDHNNSNLNYQNSRTTVNVPLPGMDFHSGACFGQDDTLFAFVDRLRGAYIFNTSVPEFRSIATGRCDDFNCEVPLVFYERYIVIRNRNTQTVAVVDSAENYSTLINALQVSTNLVTLLNLTKNSTTDVDPSTKSFPTHIFVPVFLVILGVCTGIPLAMVIIFCYLKKQTKTQDTMDRQNVSVYGNPLYRENRETEPAEGGNLEQNGDELPRPIQEASMAESDPQPDNISGQMELHGVVGPVSSSNSLPPFNRSISAEAGSNTGEHAATPTGEQEECTGQGRDVLAVGYSP